MSPDPPHLPTSRPDTSTFSTCAWSPDGTLIVTASDEGTVRVWDGQTFGQQGQLDDPLRVGHDGSTYESPFPPQSTRLQFSPDGRYLAWIFSYHCCVWGVSMAEQPKILSHPSRRSGISEPVRETRSLTFNPESSRIATAHGPHGRGSEPDLGECFVRIWEVATGAALATLTRHSGPVVNVSLSPDGASLLSTSKDGSARIWDAESGEHRATLGGSDAAILVACFSPGGEYIANGSNSGGVVCLWRTADGSCASEIPVPVSINYNCVHRLVFSPNGEFLASGDLSGTVHIYRFSDFITH